MKKNKEKGMPMKKNKNRATNAQEQNTHKSLKDKIPTTTSNTNQSELSEDKRERRDGPGGN